MFFRSKFLLIVALAVVTELIAPLAARADFQLQLSDGSTNIVTIDLIGSTATVISGNATILASASIGNYGNGSYSMSGLMISYDGFSILTNTSTTNAPGSGNVANLQLSSTNISYNGGNGGGPETLTVKISDNDYTIPTLQSTLSTNYSATYTGNGTITESSYYSSSSTLFSQGIGTTATTASGGPAINGSSLSASLSGQTSSNFTMTDVLTYTASGPGDSLTSSGINASVYAPAPSGLILAATMVPFFGLLRRRLRQTVTPVAA